MNCLANALVSSAATNVATHGVVNFRVARRRFFSKQCYCGHDLPWLTISALRNVDFHPGLLHWMSAIGRKSLDGGDLFTRDVRYGRYTRTGRLAFDMYRTGSA